MKYAIRVNNMLDRIANHQYAPLSIQWCCDSIAWLARFRKVPKDVTDALAEKATAILEDNYYGDEPFQKYLEGVL